MNDKLKLLEYAAKKVVSENAFMGFLFNRFMETEHVGENDLITLLNCSLEDYYKLCLCKAPDTTAGNYIEKVRELSEYANVQVFELNKIIKRANVIISLSQSPNSLLMAARDKTEKKDKE
jgi:hypothetical protein